MGYEQEIETDKTVLQILYTDFFPIHATFLKKKKKFKHVKPKHTFFFIINYFFFWSSFTSVYISCVHNVLGQVY